MKTQSIKITLEQLSQVYNYSKSTIETKFNQVAKSFRKKYNLDLVRCRNLQGVYYEITPLRDLNIYSTEKEELYIPFDSIKMNDLVCLIIIGIAATQYYVFKGTREEFLKHLGLVNNKRNMRLLEEALKEYSNKQGQPLLFSQDGSRIIVSFEEQFEKGQIITLNMLKKCKQIVEKYNKQALKVIQLLKVWQAYRINQYYKVNPLTDKDLKKYVDLSQSQITDAKKLLQKENVIIINRKGSYNVCQGSEFTINLFFDNRLKTVKE